MARRARKTKLQTQIENLAEDYHYVFNASKRSQDRRSEEGCSLPRSARKNIPDTRPSPSCSNSRQTERRWHQRCHFAGRSSHTPISTGVLTSLRVICGIEAPGREALLV